MDETDLGLWWDALCILSHSTNFSAGVAVLFKTSSAVTFFPAEVVTGWLLVVRAEIDNSVFCFVNVYTLNAGGERLVIFNLLKNEFTIIVGRILTARLISL